GTDELGRDILSRLLYGARFSLQTATFAVVLGLVIGAPLGLLAGYLGGWLDGLAMRCLDGLLAFPSLLVAIVLVALLGPGLPNLVLTLGLLAVPAFARLARGSTLVARQQPYVTAAVALGASGARIMSRHILPNVAAPLIVQASLSYGLM